MTTPSNYLSLPVEYLRATVAGSAAFQTWVGAANATEAAQRIYVTADEDYLVHPCAWIEWAPGWERRKIANNAWEGSGSPLRLNFRADVVVGVGAQRLTDEAFELMNVVGQVLAEMEVLAGQPGYLDIRSMRLSDGPWRPLEDEAKVADFWTVTFEIEYWDGR